MDGNIVIKSVPNSDSAISFPDYGLSWNEGELTAWNPWCHSIYLTLPCYVIQVETFA